MDGAGREWFFRDLEEYTRRAHAVGPGPQSQLSDV